MYNYIVTAQKNTAVFNCLTGNFTSPNDRNLILDKLTRVEVYLLTPEGLRLLNEISIYGRITVMKSIRLPTEKKDYLFILTFKCNAMILELDKNPDTGDFRVITRAHGIITEKNLRPAESGTICAVNENNRLIALRISDGILNVLKIDFEKNEIKSNNIRMEENTIIDFVFLECYDKPVICYIYQEDSCRHLKTCEITEDKELKNGPWYQENIEADSIFLIPVPRPHCGVIVIGQESITHIIDTNIYTAIAPPCLRTSKIICYYKIDNERFLIGDSSGRLFVLILSDNEKAKYLSSSSNSSPYTLKLIYLGEASTPSCMAYLDNNHFYIGSRLADSQLIKINMNNLNDGNYIEIIENYVSLAPIIDMVVVDLDKQGQDQLITCSGFAKDGSIRIIRNGIGINEFATIDLPGINGIWQLRVNSQYDNMVAVSFVGLTKLLKLENEEVEETFINGFDCSQQTLYCCNVTDDLILQATISCIRLISVSNSKQISEWADSPISLISFNGSQLICSSATKLYYFEIIENELKLINKMDTEHEPSCIDISQLSQNKSKFCAVAFWEDISVHILSIPDFKLLYCEKLGGEIIPRSTLMAHFDNTDYLFIAIGDGLLLYFVMDSETGVLSERKKVILGTHPTFLQLFRTNSSMNIFACSDRPTVIYSNNYKLIFSNVNLKKVNYMCSFNSLEYPDSLILTNDDQLLIGQIDQIQKLHIRTINLYETPRRIVYQESTLTFGLITMRKDIQQEDGQLVSLRSSVSTLAYNKTNSLGTTAFSSRSLGLTFPSEIEIYNLLIIDQMTFEVIHAHQFMMNEHAISITSAKLGSDPNEYFIVGTAFVYMEDMEPKDGRIIVFKYADGRLQQVAQKETKGAPYSMLEFHGKLLVTINSAIRLYEWTTTNELNLETSIFNSILSIYLKSRGDFVLVGDIVRSFACYAYNQLSGTFTNICNDHETSWLSAIEFIDEETFLGSDNYFNLYYAQKETNISENLEKSKNLKQSGFIHIGDYINVLRHGHLVMNHPCEMMVPIINKPIIYGSYSGAIGLVVQIPKRYYDLLLALQIKLSKIVKSVGKIDYQFWRSFTQDKRTEPMLNFIDGDLIESFLDLNIKEKTECIQDIKFDLENENVTIEEIVKIVEDMSRIH